MSRECWVCESSIPESAVYCPDCGEVQLLDEDDESELVTDGGDYP